MVTNLKRIAILFRQFSMGEFTKALFGHFITGTLHDSNHSLFSALVVFIHAADKDGSARKIGGGNLIRFQERCLDCEVMLRRGSSDFFVFNQIFIRRDYDHLLNAIREQSSHRAVSYIIDAGANIGCATILFKTWFPDAEVISVEPESSNYAMLEKNVSLNKLSGVHLVQGGLWTKDENLTVRSDFRDGSHSAFTVNSAADGQENTIEGFTVKGLLTRHSFPHVDLLKIDIEGAEQYIFSDDAHLQSFLPWVRCLAVEVHEECISEAEVATKLEQAGFACSRSGEYLIAFNQKTNV